MDLKNLHSFLQFGCYLKSDSGFSVPVPDIDRRKFEKATEPELVRVAVRELKKAVTANFVSNAVHVVPLSGGLDSRALLAALLEHVDADKIRTFTFGIPGASDFDIGNRIAHLLGTRHTSYPLDRFEYNRDAVFESAKRMGLHTVLFHHPPLRDMDEKYRDCVIWSGFMGGEVAGAHMPGTPSESLERAKDSFIRKNTFVNSVKLGAWDESDFHDMLETFNVGNDVLNYEEQLDFKNRQSKYIAPQVFFHGHTFKAPFLDPGWLHLMLSVGTRYRKGMTLYKKTLLTAFPRLFSLPTKSHFGLPLDAGKGRILFAKMNNRLSKISGFSGNANLNYMDFNQAIRTRSDFRKIIYDSIMDLRSRKLLGRIDPVALWQRHCDGKENHANALMVLASLEIHLKCGKEI